MPCGSCVDKLARKLMSHHKIDLIRAYELAEKGVERVENRNVEVKRGNPSDYSVACEPTGTCTCEQVETWCEITINNCSTKSCIPPKSHSHVVSSSCAPTYKCGTFANYCIPCTCKATGYCYYDCDEGYVWNPATQECEVAPVGIVSKRLLVGEGL